MSLAVLLAQHNDVVVLDLDAARVDKINAKQSTVLMLRFKPFYWRKSCLTATLDKHMAYKDANFVVVAAPTNYDPDTNSLIPAR